MAVWSRWLESATRRVGFRALKKTLEAPYTTKVNNRERTTRGTTLRLVTSCVLAAILGFLGRYPYMTELSVYIPSNYGFRLNNGRNGSS